MEAKRKSRLIIICIMLFAFYSGVSIAYSEAVALDGGKDAGYSIDVISFQMEFRKLVDNLAAAAKISPEETERAADELMKRMDYYSGRKFDAKRRIEKESTYLLYAYGYLMKAYINSGNCAKANDYYGQFIGLAEKDYFVIGTGYSDAFDPVTDRDVYLSRKGENLGYLMRDIDLAENDCVPFENIKWLEGYNDEFANYMKYDNIREYAFRHLKNNPEAAIKEAEEMEKIAEVFKGHHFSFGRTYKEGSSLTLWKYLLLINAYDTKKDCEKAREYIEKFEKEAGGNFFVISHKSELLLDHYTFGAYDPEIDGETYINKRMEDLSNMASYYKPECNCFSAKDYETMFK